MDRQPAGPRYHADMALLPVVAVVGRPNVGKSTLVNRIVGGRPAVVEERPGVTRDRREFDADWAGRDFVLVDTGGWELKPGEPLSSEIRGQAEAALGAADLVLFVVDATTGLTDDDDGVLRMLRGAEIPVLVVANKVDNPGREVVDEVFWRTGFGDPHPVSAFHGRGVGDLLDEVTKLLPAPVDEPSQNAIPRVAIVGRPNVGKSTLVNHLLGEQRVIVSATPGTTRDPIDALLEFDDGTSYTLIDTAGIRRNPQIKEDADYYSVLRAREALKSADIALLLVDASEGVTNQDQRIAGEVLDAGVGLALILNKWDRIDEESRQRIESDLGEQFGFVSWAPVVRISAIRGAKTARMWPAVELVLENRRRRIPTGELNRHITEWTSAHPPPTRKGRRPRLRYVVQAGIEPPTFVLFVSGGELDPTYLRFLERKMRTVTDFTGSPLKLIARTGRT